MSLTGSLTATEKLVPSERLYITPIQFDPKNNLYVPESLEQEIPDTRSPISVAEESQSISWPTSSLHSTYFVNHNRCIK